MVMLGDVELIWEEFNEIFLEKYLSDTSQQRLREEFTRLRQGDSSVADYAQKFMSLSRFAPVMIVVEVMAVKRFIFGLKHSIRRYIPNRGDMSLDSVIEAAKRQEYMEEDETSLMLLVVPHGSGSQSTGLPPKDLGRDGQGCHNACSYQEGQNMGRTGLHGLVRAGTLVGRGIGTLIPRVLLYSHIVGLVLRVDDLELKVGAEVAGNMDSWAIHSSNARKFSAFTARDTGITRMSVRRGKTWDLLLQHQLLTSGISSWG